MVALTTIFTPASWCSNRFVVFVDNHAPGTSTNPPSSGWIDPSFTKCIPTQYTTAYPTFSPGVCPAHMQIVRHTSDIYDSETVWAAACCQSGFSPMPVDPEYLCTSSITSPMAFLLDPNVSTADVYTTLAPEIWIEHDQMTVEWQPSDLSLLPVNVASQYQLMMGITAPPSTTDAATMTTAPAVSGTSAKTQKRTSRTVLTMLIPGTKRSHFRNSTSQTQSQVDITYAAIVINTILNSIIAIYVFGRLIPITHATWGPALSRGVHVNMGTAISSPHGIQHRADRHKIRSAIGRGQRLEKLPLFVRWDLHPQTWDVPLRFTRHEQATRQRRDVTTALDVHRPYTYIQE
ncbi:hypothetical protein EKO27_g8290 [Xylaria grammica]|uniref:Uncharacterized protein n=1 Tax=Xylaria grammica TaxID=363999 RepID=A0A439CXT2_9PEZI|nr:hypothetical protein EKO27_g8290 [Xylaria grammica]